MPDGPVLALVRPEDIALAADGIAGTVISSSFLGSLRRTRVRLDDGTGRRDPARSGAASAARRSGHGAT